jgi:hypothetical protein
LNFLVAEESSFPQDALFIRTGIAKRMVGNRLPPQPSSAASQSFGGLAPIAYGVIADHSNRTVGIMAAG